MKGAGGTSGGIGQFLVGFFMLCGGLYLLLNAIKVQSTFGFGMALYHVGVGNGFNITGGMVMIPFVFGVGLLFFNGKNLVGWLLALGSIAALIFGVITSIQFSLANMTAFELITILVLAFGGLGLFLRSLKSVEASADADDGV